jgi:two-component system response regulator FlrC
MIIGHLDGHISQAGKIALQRGAKVIHCEDTNQAVGALLNGKGADLVMVDVKQNIGEFVERLEEEHICIPVIACGVDNDARSAVKAIQDGAKEYVPLPPDADLIAAVLQAITEESSDMIASDPSMQKIVKLADQIAPTEATILITGESGTGKEVMSQYIHGKSKRSSGPFIAVNCAAIPENLLESELFGHEKGAFTGATGRRIGKFEEATGGTILLDEITEMDISLQAKLLRVLQEREVTRVGANKPVKVDVRILATSNRDLQASVEKKEFREDLYFRLNVVNIPLPALRERPKDLITLAKFFADKYAEANGVGKKKLSQGAQDKIASYGWRGNIRELENTMHRAIIVATESEIEAEAIHIQDNDFTRGQETHGGGFGSDTQAPQETAPAATEPNTTGQPVIIENPGGVEQLVGRTIAGVERDMILNTLGHCLGNRTHAANILGISIRTLRNKLNQYKDDGADIPAAGTGGA